MRFLLYAQSLSAKERHVILPLMIATFIMQSVAFILCHHKYIQRSIFSYTKWSNTFRSIFYGPIPVLPLTRTHCSILPLIFRYAQFCPFAVSVTYRNALPSRYRLVKGCWPLSGRLLDILPLTTCVIYRWDPLKKNKNKNHIHSLTHLHVDPS